VCYWPNLGYGLFGKKITMDRSPWFDAADLFDQRRIRFADIDGSGVTDIIYLAHDGVRLYFNQSGNSWSEPRTLSVFPGVDDLEEVQALDLLGNGTACLVWTSSLPADVGRSMRYVDLMGGYKPHLLIGSRNNLGSETRIFYAPSTKFYLDDRATGQPWVTRLPFPVHVVERVETCDWVSRNRFVTRYAYHHGFYDGIEREFRGFGRVDQYDTEELGALSESSVFPDAANVDAASYVPTVLTKTWFHTGASTDENRISRQFEHEYWRESDPFVSLDSVLPPEIDGDEFAEACRSLKGAILRQEIYALDGGDEDGRPYTVSEHNYTSKRLQPRGANRHAVFFSHARETIALNYERKSDPRVSQSVTLAVDDYGNQLQSAAIAYGRGSDDPDSRLTLADRENQRKPHVLYTETTYTNAILADDDYRPPLPADASTFELIHVIPEGGLANAQLIGFDALAAKVAQASDGHHDLPYEDIAASGAVEAHPYRRLVEQIRTIYRQDDLTSCLPLGQLQAKALPCESYKLALTSGLLRIFARDGEALLTDAAAVLREGGYVSGDDAKASGLFPVSDPDAQWWIPSGRIFYSPDQADTPAQELAAATAHFFSPRRFRDPFGHYATVVYDAHDLLVLETEDALHNKMTVGERTPGGIVNRNDYRVLQPALVTDPNGNCTQVVFDALGMVAGTAVMGKAGEKLGDSLEGFQPDLTQHEIEVFLADPKSPSAALLTPEEIARLHANPNGTLAAALLGNATTRIVYDLGRFAPAPSRRDSPLPACAATIARETHVHDLLEGQESRLQVSLSYSDGFGREIQKKLQAEPGPLVEGGQSVPLRWVGSGWTIFNNKGKPVRQYEPFFDDTHDFKPGIQAGVSPVHFYDPVGRVVATLHADHTFEKVLFDPWRQESWDVNDAVTLDPRHDQTLKDFVLRLPDEDYLPTWFVLRTDPAFATMRETLWPDVKLRDAETDAASKAAKHANTPTVAFFDALGRPFLTIVHNKFEDGAATIEETYATRVQLDIEGNQRAVIDALDRVVMRYDYDMLGTRIHQVSMEAGERWVLSDVTGKPIRGWNSRKYAFSTEYDSLRRPVKSFVQGGDPAEPNARLFPQPVLYEKTIYGESAETGLNEAQKLEANLRGKVFAHFDCAGIVKSYVEDPAPAPGRRAQAYDFKGNPLGSSRQLLRDYKSTPDWPRDAALPSPPLESETFFTRTAYDALNRPTAVTTPDKSVYLPAFNEAGLLDKVEVKLRGASESAAFVRNIDYNAKGQRTLIDYGNGASTLYAYDDKTFRLTKLLTRRNASAFPGDCPNPPPADWPGCQVQNLSYAYDPAGNITHIQDDAQQTIYFSNNRVEPSADYAYDATYRLIKAEGREHIGQASQPWPTWDDAFRTRLPHPGDGRAMRRYAEEYQYDPVGNFMAMLHQAPIPQLPANNSNWRRSYFYNEASLIEPGKVSNRLSRTTVGGDNPVTETYTYDAHGNMTSMPHLSLMQWDFRDQLSATSRQVSSATPETTYYVYDSGGQRVRKVTEGQTAAGQTPKRRKERIYLGGYEVYRGYDADGASVSLERETLHVMDDKQRIALVETRTQGSETGVPQQLIRYQFSNHLGSASLELDDQAQMISYEEYYPYGSTSYQAVSSGTGTPKRYRYTGMERDEESGLNYQRARYYASWLGRWVTCDPGGLHDGTNVYQYVNSSPIMLIDKSGMNGNSPKLNDVIPYGSKVKNRAKLGKNVQKDHIIAQEKIAIMRTDPHGKLHYNKNKDLTVLADTGKATGIEAAKPHTQKTFHDPQSDVKEIARLKKEGIKSISGDIVEPSLDAAIRSGYDPKAVHKAAWSQLNELFSSQSLAQSGEEVAALAHVLISSTTASGTSAPSSSRNPQKGSASISVIFSLASIAVLAAELWKTGINKEVAKELAKGVLVQESETGVLMAIGGRSAGGLAGLFVGLQSDSASHNKDMDRIEAEKQAEEWLTEHASAYWDTHPELGSDPGLVKAKEVIVRGILERRQSENKAMRRWAERIGLIDHWQ
jgi:RHS repeat-associated protein